MKLKQWRKILVALTFISAVVSTVFITWKIVQHNNAAVETKTNNRLYRPVDINDEDKFKLLNYQNNNYVFNLHNAEYYLVHKTLGLYPELANKTFSFSVDNKLMPKVLEMRISTKQETKWIYSII